MGYTYNTAAEALGKLGDGRAGEPLLKVLGDTNTRVRAAAAEALICQDAHQHRDGDRHRGSCGKDQREGGF
jgi:HEAT repeat protein